MAEPITEAEGDEPFRYPSETPGYLRLRLRTRVEVFKGTDIWHEVFVDKWSSVLETAILLCDLWEKHWCVAASERVDKMVPTVEFGDLVRPGTLESRSSIVPSGTVDKYSGTALSQGEFRTFHVSRRCPLRAEIVQHRHCPSLTLTTVANRAMDPTIPGTQTTSGHHNRWERRDLGRRRGDLQLLAAQGAPAPDYHGRTHKRMRHESNIWHQAND